MAQNVDIGIYRDEFSRYREEYLLTHPLPVLHLRSPMGEWRFWVFGPVALFAPVVSGFRTFASFAHVAAIWSLVEGVLGVLTVELGLIGYQVERIQRRARAGKLRGLGEAWLVAGVLITLLIALLANVDLVLERAGQPIPAPWRGYLIGGVIGGLVPLLGLIAGEVLGRLFYEIDEVNQAARARHVESLRQWEESLASSWNSQKGRRLRPWTLTGQLPDSVRTGDQGEEDVRPIVPRWPDKDTFLADPGRPKAMTDRTLAVMAGISDRTARRWLAEARKLRNGNGE